MSVIAVKKHETKIEICADSQYTRGYNKNSDSTKLIKTNDRLCIGQCGHASEANLFNHFAESRCPERNDCSAILDFLLEFISYKDKKIGNKIFDNQHIIVFEKKVYSHECFLVKEIQDFYAIGSGYNEALTALYLGKTAFEAVEIACKLTLYCGFPVKKVEIEL